MVVDSRVAKAATAMKRLGIPWVTVKPALKRLLNLYDKNWKLIEEDNYRTLADAIFEYADEEVAEDKKKDSKMNDEMEPPLKKPNVGQHVDQVSSTMDNASIIRGLEEGEMLQICSGLKLKESSQSLSFQLAPSRRNLSSGRSSCALYSNRAMNGPSFVHRERGKMPEVSDDEDLIKPKARQSVNGLPHFCVPTSHVKSALPGSVEVSFTGNGSAKYFTFCSACDYGPRSGNTFDIASSACGKVKISFDCSPALGQLNFKTPNWNEVLKYVEHKYLSSYRIAGRQFSGTEFLKELCECYLELGGDTTKQSLTNRTSGECLLRIMGPCKESAGTGNLERNLNVKVPSCSGSSNSYGFMVSQQQPLSPNKNTSFHQISDITKGTEKVSISVVDETGNEHFPNFVYVPHNIIYQNAYLHVSLARIADEDCCSSCIGNCLLSSVPCACARDTGGEFAYTPQGLLKEEFLRDCISMNQEPHKHYHVYCTDCPIEKAKYGYSPAKCKGHLLRKFIKECWRKCGCNMLCGNRVVQRGIICKLQVFFTNGGKGWSLRTLEDLPKGSFVCEYIGEILTNMELYDRNMIRSGNERHTYPVLLDADWGSEGVLKDEDALCLDATYYGNVARFINHRCFDSNLLEIPVEVETPDHHYYHLAFFTKRKVDAMEELTWDYGIDFDDHNHPIKAFRCFCGSTFCRDKKGKRFHI